MSLFSPKLPTIDPRAPYEALDDLIALFKAEPLLHRLSFDTHWRGWHDEHPPSNPRMMFWVSAWVGKTEVQSPQGLAVSQAVERVMIDRGLMIEPEEGYNWNGPNTLVSPWKRKDLVRAFEQEAKTPLTDPNRLALLRSQAMLEHMNLARLERQSLAYRRDTIVKLMDELASVPEVPVDPPNTPSAAVLHLRRKLHALRGDPVIQRIDQAAARASEAGFQPVPHEDDELQDMATETPVTTARARRRPGR